MARFRDGDLDAFAAIYDRHASVAYSLAYRMCRRRAAAEDIVQEAFLSLARSGARCDRTGSVRSSLLQAVHNRAIDVLRREPLFVNHTLRDDQLEARLTTLPLSEDVAVSHDAPLQLRQALQKLPAEQSAAIELAFFDGLTHHEISHLLELPPDVAKRWMHLGLQTLRVVL